MALGGCSSHVPFLFSHVQDVEERLKRWSPMALGSKTGEMGGTACLSCDNRVRSTRDMQVS